MYRVQYKRRHAQESWTAIGSYQNESNALQAATRYIGKCLIVRVIDGKGHAVWSH